MLARANNVLDSPAAHPEREGTAQTTDDEGFTGRLDQEVCTPIGFVDNMCAIGHAVNPNAQVVAGVRTVTTD